MQRPEPVILESERVRLEPIRHAHAAGLHRIGREPDTFTWMSRGPFPTEQDAALEVQRMLDEQAAGRRIPFAVIDRTTAPSDDRDAGAANGTLAGTTSWLDIRPEDGGVEIGWTWYGPAFRRTHVNSETKRLLLGHAFDDLGAERVQLLTDERNAPSRTAILRLGASFEGILRRHKVYPSGFVRNSALYSIIRDEWPAIRARMDGDGTSG